jgi:host factor-I protein
MKHSPPINIQDIFLNLMRKKGVEGTVFLVNGFQVRGKIKAFDKFTIVLDSNGKQQVIFKHAVSTVVPDSPIEWEKEKS